MLSDISKTKQAAPPLCCLLEFKVYFLPVRRHKQKNILCFILWPCLESLCILHMFMKSWIFLRAWSKKKHEVLNGRANMNCVISSSPTTGLRTVHLLRSILFRALPSHAMPADSTLCLHLHFNIKFWHELSFKPSTTNAVMPSQHVPPSQRKFPLDFKWLDGPSRWRSLIYLLSCRWWNTHVFKKVLNVFL